MTSPDRRIGPLPLDVAIIGAGFGGLGLAIRLKQAGHASFAVFEQAPDIGGTWRDNTYPGCACDIPAALYCFSFATDGDWSRRYPTQPEILAYLKDCVRRFGIAPHLRLGQELRGATFDPVRSLWRLTLTAAETVEARVLVVSVGPLHRPAIPAIQGLEQFAGPRFHSARWDHSVGLAGKHVAVIGTGASAIQFVPRIAAEAGHITLYQRTPSWVLPKRNPVSGPIVRSFLRHMAPLRLAIRAWTFWSHEIAALGFNRLRWLTRAAERRARSHAKRQLTDHTLRLAMTPDYLIGCKRVLLSNDFYPALGRQNVEVVTTPIARVTPHAIITADGTARAADIVMFATGFQATEPSGLPEITGPDGRTLGQTWRDGMRARLGVAVAGFPNLFLLGGPNTGLGHNSVVFMLEAQISHILRCLRLMTRRGAAAIEVRADAQDRCMNWIQRRMGRTVWLSGCRSWYLDQFGHNTALWPGFAVGYWARTRLVTGYRLSYAVPHDV